MKPPTTEFDQTMHLLLNVLKRIINVNRMVFITTYVRKIDTAYQFILLVYTLITSQPRSMLLKRMAMQYE